MLELAEESAKQPIDAESLFDYKAPNEVSKKHKEASPQPQQQQQQRQQPARYQPRFARTQTTIGQRQGLWPKPSMSPNNPYAFASNTGRGASDNGIPGYGNFFQSNYGPMGGPSSTLSGMGSFPNSIDPRGFGMDSNMSKPWNLGGSQGGVPSFGEPMLAGRAFPTQLTGYSGVNAVNAGGMMGGGMMGGGMMGPGGMPSPPFTGQEFTALSPFGPYKLSGGSTDPNVAVPIANTTLMGPLPFGPYGGSPTPNSMGMGGMGMHPGMMGMGGMGMNGMPMAFGGGMGGMGHPGMTSGSMPFGMGMGGMGGGMSPYGGPMGAMGSSMGTMPGFNSGMGHPGMMGTGGLNPTYNPMIAMHHQATMGGGMQMFSPPGMFPTSGMGYPHPDNDRYHTIIRSPPPPIGGGEAAKAF